MPYFKYLSARDSVGTEQLIKIINEQECSIAGQQFSLALQPITLNEIKMKTNSNNKQYIYISSERELRSDLLSVDVTQNNVRLGFQLQYKCFSVPKIKSQKLYKYQCQIQQYADFLNNPLVEIGPCSIDNYHSIRLQEVATKSLSGQLISFSNFAVLMTATQFSYYKLTKIFNINFSGFKLRDRNRWLQLFITKTQYSIGNKQVIAFSGLIVISFLVRPGWTGLGAFVYFSLLIIIQKF